MTRVLTYQEVAQVIGRGLGHYDVRCPLCGPKCRSAANQRRPVLRIWRLSPGFLTFSCARCGAHGYLKEEGTSRPSSRELAHARAEAARFAAAAGAARRNKARWLWPQRRPPEGTLVERYLREARRYNGPLPGTIGFLPARNAHAPAMISAFGMPDEIEPGVISIASAAVEAVHLTKLSSDGSAKAGTERDKIMVGTPRGVPIVVAPIGDQLGLAVTEGIEDAFSVHEATGLGVWAAGSATLMPGLAPVVPKWMECVTIVADDDYTGRRNADELAIQLEKRGIDVRLIVPALLCLSC
jgi:hypothetical protein